ncbi:RHS repeat protein, partial [Taibaiella chishuiensis]
GGGNTLVGKLEQKINGNPFNIANYSYDHLNRVVVKDGRACMTLNEYNIRGFLTHIAAEDHSQPTISRFFDERLRYEWGFRDKHYNGNIAGITWSGGDGKKHAYGYTYDSLDRLTHAEHRHLSGGNWVNTDWNYTASNISYDLNGNIKTMNQKGGSYPGAAQNMDILSYQYGSNSNQLQSVEDAGTAINGLPDFRNGVSQAIEYTYDQNGNMTRDDNKGLTVSYNHLNKPAAITVTGKGSIYYTYDAGGNLLRKKLDSAGVITLYDYFGNFVYKSDVLQYITNEEGRARPIANDTTAHLTRFVYDYFVKDHLGNVRSTVTAEPINRDYLARHEMATAGVEQLVFDNIPNVRESKPGSTNPDDGMAARLEGGNPNTQVGTAIMLKVMPGDKFEISADSYYEGENQTQEESGAGPIISSLMNALMGGGTYAGTPVSELPDNLKTISGLLSNPVLPEQLRGLQSNDNPMVPKAHINYLFFDSKMQLVTGLSGSIQVQGGGPSGWHNSGSVTIGPGTVGNNVIQPSYVIIYIDNQTIGKNVWFDNMRVEHYTSKLLEEDHYYPFGLTIHLEQAGQSNLPRNDIKFQGQRHDNDFGINIYSFKYREHDPTIGRFWQVDPLSEKYVHNSTYAFSENKVTSHIELEGLESFSIQPEINQAWRELKANFQNLANSVNIGGSAYVEMKEDGKSIKPTVTVKTNAGDWMNYLTHTNTNQGGPSFFKFDFSVESSVEKKAEVKTLIGSAAGGVQINQKGETTVTAEASIKTPGGNLGASVSQSSNGTTTVSGNISVEMGSATVKAEASVVNKQNAVGLVSGFGVEQKVGTRTFGFGASA